MAIDFQWDEKKNRTNRRKHGVSFEADKEEEGDYLTGKG
jgi:uncharacterized DUF497 family protein